VKRTALLLLSALLLGGSAYAQPPPSTLPRLTLEVPPGLYYEGRKLTIAWKRPPPAGYSETATSLLTITLVREVEKVISWEKEPPPLEWVRLAVTNVVGSEGVWTQAIPPDVQPGKYRLEVTQVPGTEKEKIFEAVWGRSERAIIIVPKPAITLLPSPYPRKEIKAGSFPEFGFTLQLSTPNLVQAYLMRDGKPLGQLLGRMRAREGENGFFTGSFVWELTRYLGKNGKWFAEPGEGYQVAMGILKEGGWENRSSFDEAFISYSETEPFAITGTPPQLILLNLKEAWWVSVAAEPYPVLMTWHPVYVAGPPHAQYDIHFSREIPPVKWEYMITATTDEYGVWKGLFNPRGNPTVFLGLTPSRGSNR
jgi:hypothetical protein